jgi:biotin carboxyl carrier protein
VTAVLELVLEESGGSVRLLSPEVGWFTEALPRGAEVSPGERAGSLLSLGRVFELRFPAGASGVVTSSPPDRARAPVSFGQVLYQLASAKSAPRPEKVEEARGGALVLRSPQAGRFYHRPSPNEAAFVTAGATVEDGQPIGMIEVMKTFSHVPYRASGGLPRRAKIVRVIAADGADVKPGEALIEVEPS